MPKATLPVIGFAAYSGTGKTTLLTRIIPALRTQGLRVGLVKHAHHGFDPDIPGKDSYRLRKAGAAQTLVASPRRQALFTENESPREPVLEDLLAQLDPARLDLVLVEGFRGEAIPKIELHRAGLGHPWLFPEIPNIIAVATDGPLATETPHPPLLDLNRPDEVAGFVMDRWQHGELGAH